MSTNQSMNRIATGIGKRLAESLLLIALIAAPSLSLAEPLAYVLRSARYDIGVADVPSNRALGGVPLNSILSGEISRDAVLNFIALSPDGTAGLIGGSHTGLMHFDVLSTDWATFADSQGRP